MTKLYKEFRTSLKDIAVEEAVDLLLFRPVSFLLVKVFVRLPITPNQISLLAIFAGIASGIFFSFGTREHFFYGGLFYAFSHILDCCDGMVARLKKNGTPIGRIIDGWADYITSTVVYIGFFIGLLKSSIDLPVHPLILVAFSGFCLATHSATVDFHRWEFMAHGLGKVNPLEQDLATYSALLEKLKRKKGHLVERVLITFYLGYTNIQLKKNGAKQIPDYQQEPYYQSNRLLLALWNFIGLSTHIFMLVLSAVLYEPLIFFVYVLIIANLWMLLLGAIQVHVNKRIPVKAKA